MKLTPRLVSDLAPEHALSVVEKLNVSNRGIDGVVGLEACSSLHRLDASGNKLTEADGLAACPALTWLSVAKNALPSLDPLKGLEKLEVLNAAHNQLKGKASVGRLKALKALILNNNEITMLGGVDKLKSLDTLVLSSNRVASVQGWLAGAAALQKLSLSHNPLTQLGGALRGCPALQELRLNHCELSGLPAELALNQKLRILEAGGNAIACLDGVAVVAQLPALRQLSLKGCPVALLPGYRERVLQLAPRLEVLDNQRVAGAGGGRKRRRRNEEEASDEEHRLAAGEAAAAVADTGRGASARQAGVRDVPRQGAAKKKGGKLGVEEAPAGDAEPGAVVGAGSKRAKLAKDAPKSAPLDGAADVLGAAPGGKPKTSKTVVAADVLGAGAGGKPKKSKMKTTETAAARLQLPPGAPAAAGYDTGDDDAADAAVAFAPPPPGRLRMDPKRTGAVGVIEVARGRQRGKGKKERQAGGGGAGAGKKGGREALQALLRPAPQPDEQPGWD